MSEHEKTNAASGTQAENGESSALNSASAAALAQANLSQTVSDALALASLNAVQAQQQTNILHQTVTATGMAQMYASSLGIRRWAGITYGQHLGIPTPDQPPVNPSQDVAQVLKDMEAIATFLKNASLDNAPSADANESSDPNANHNSPAANGDDSTQQPPSETPTNLEES